MQSFEVLARDCPTPFNIQFPKKEKQIVSAIEKGAGTKKFSIVEPRSLFDQ